MQDVDNNEVVTWCACIIALGGVLVSTCHEMVVVGSAWLITPVISEAESSASSEIKPAGIASHTTGGELLSGTEALLSTVISAGGPLSTNSARVLSSPRERTGTFNTSSILEPKLHSCFYEETRCS